MPLTSAEAEVVAQHLARAYNLLRGRDGAALRKLLTFWKWFEKRYHRGY